MSTQLQIRKDIDFISKINGIGNLSKALTNNLFGFDHINKGTPGPRNRENYGLVFFTRPSLNLSSGNLMSNRVLRPLLNRDPNSIARYIRATLDPKSNNAAVRGRFVNRSEVSRRNSLDSETIISNLCDPENPFIPLLSNSIVNLTGFPDINLDVYSSKPGPWKESWSMVDSASEIFYPYDLTANFQNISGDPITLLITTWVHYASLVYQGEIVPYPDAIIENKIDYTSRIYRVILDTDRETVTKLGAIGVGFPTASPIGQFFNYNSESVFIETMDTISVPFRCMGANYNDIILIKEFNAVVGMFNTAMRGVIESIVENGNQSDNLHGMQRINLHERSDNGVIIGRYISNYLKYRAYPLINPRNNRLEWWVRKADYDQAKEDILERGLADVLNNDN